jgi:hypothetical protein
VKNVAALLVLFASIVFSSNVLHAQTVTADTVQAPDGDALTLTSTVGTNLIGGSINIQATNGGTFSMSTDGQNDMDLTPSGNVVLWPQTSGYQVIMYAPGATALVQTDYGLQIQPNAAQPACNSSLRGTLFPVNGDTGVADSLQLCKKNADETFSWHTVP